MQAPFSLIPVFQVDDLCKMKLHDDAGNIETSGIARTGLVWYFILCLYSIPTPAQ